MQHNGPIYYAGLAILLTTLFCLAVGTLIVFQIRMAKKARLAIEEGKYELQKRLSFINARLQRDISDWQRKAAFAEKALIDFYIAQGLLAEIRESPSHRTRSFSEYRTVKALLDKNRESINELQMKRHLAQALFGADGGAAYQALLDVFRDVRLSSNFLAEAAFADDSVDPNLRAHHEGIIWAGAFDEEDPIKMRLGGAMRGAEEVFGTVLRPR